MASRRSALTPGRLMLLALAAASTACMTVNVRGVGTPGKEKRPIRSVVVPPLLNRTHNSAAGAIMRDLIADRLTTQANLKIIDLPDDFVIYPERMDRTRAQEIAVKLGADALLLGTVFAYEYDNAPGGVEAPSIRLDLRLVAAASGSVVWAAAADGLQPILFTNDSIPMAALAERVATDLARDLANRL